MKFVKTHFADCLLGVMTRRTMQIMSVARTLMGANQRTILWRVLVVREQITPLIMSIAIESKTV